MYKVSKHLSEQLKIIKTKKEKVDFCISYLSKLVDKSNVRILEDGEINELLGIVDSIIEFSEGNQKNSLLVIYNALIAEEARRLDKALKNNLFARLKRKVLKFIK